VGSTGLTIRVNQKGANRTCDFQLSDNPTDWSKLELYGEPVTKSNEIRFNLRRSQRVHAQLPVVVQGMLADETPFVDPTRAIVLSAHGCLITLSESVTLGERLILRNVATREEQDCRVVYLGEKQGGRTEVGLQFKTAAPQFWGLEHPPPDWKKILS
jgi:hypothetical protein